MIVNAPAAREPRAPHTRKTAAATNADTTPATADGADAAATQAQEQALAIQKQQFDFETQERAELEREHEALQALLMAMLKNEDEITKKWIELI